MSNRQEGVVGVITIVLIVLGLVAVLNGCESRVETPLPERSSDLSPVEQLELDDVRFYLKQAAEREKWEKRAKVLEDRLFKDVDEEIRRREAGLRKGKETEKKQD